MAWLWKQGRPTLLAMVGMGVLGYKALHRGHAPVQQGQAEVGVWDTALSAADFSALHNSGVGDQYPF